MTWFYKICQEPTLHFFVIGLIIWAVDSSYDQSKNRYQIDIDQKLHSRLSSQYEKQYTQAPSNEQMAALLDRYIQDEIFWREGMALGLSEQDEIVRRRIIQKFKFLQSDLNVIETPSNQLLQTWYELNQQRFVQTAQVSFRHVYFSEVINEGQTAKDRASQALKALPADIETRGDSFPTQRNLDFLNHSLAERLFGDSEFTSKLFTAPTQKWIGPYQSGYGWHLLYIEERTPPTHPVFANIKDQVLAEYQRDRRQQKNQESFKRLRAKYNVVFEVSK